MADFQQWSCDVLVIGAGPAGSTAARFAAQKGVKVILLERREMIGLPVRCAEYVPLPVSRYADLKASGILVQPVRSMRNFIEFNWNEGNAHEIMHFYFFPGQKGLKGPSRCLTYGWRRLSSGHPSTLCLFRPKNSHLVFRGYSCLGQFL